MKTSLQFHEQAEFLRESSGSTNIEKTLIKAVKVLALFDIPHYVCGGFAVQEHGYPRFTVDVDIIVPDVEFAREKFVAERFQGNESRSPSPPWWEQGRSRTAHLADADNRLRYTATPHAP